MNNTVIFRHKYLKYKNKYQILKNEIIQKGSGRPPFECLFFSTVPLPYNLNLFGFYEVGIYNTANYNMSEITSKSDDVLDDIYSQPIEFWYNLENELKKMNKFKVAMFDDNLSIFLQYRDTSIIKQICKILSTYLLPTGIVFIESRKPYTEDIHNVNLMYLDYFHTSLQVHGFKIIGTIGIKNEDENEFYTLYCRMPYISSNKANPNFKYIKESSQLEFIMKKILSDTTIYNNKILIDYSLYSFPNLYKQRLEEIQDDNNRFMKKEKVDLSYEFTDTKEENKQTLQITPKANTHTNTRDHICIPNLNGQYPTHIECENAKISK